MMLSTDRILTTHVGSLPRPDDLIELMLVEDRHETDDPEMLGARISEAVRDVVAKQVGLGIDVVSDGELGKIAYTFYVKHRLSNIADGVPPGAEVPKDVANLDLLDHPDFAERARLSRHTWSLLYDRPCCTGPVMYENRAPLERDLGNLKEAVTVSRPVEAFMNAASPGVLSKFVPDAF